MRKKVQALLTIENVPEYAPDYPFWIVRIDEEEQDRAWFWSAYETEEQAKECVKDLHRGVIVRSGNEK